MLEHFLNGLGDYPSEYPDDAARAAGWKKRTLRGGGAGKPNGILVPLYEPIF